MAKPTNWNELDMERVRKAASLIRNPHCTDADAVALIVNLMDMAEASGQIKALAKARAAITGGAQC